MFRNLASSLTLPARRSFSSCHASLSGHNKWSKIKQKKGANDAQKGVVYGKASRDITMACRSGGSTDPTKNLQLAAALKRAKEMDVPKENIEKAIAKSQKKDQAGDTFVYEALVFNSVGLIIECATDNKNRTIHTVRETLNDYGARAAPVKFMFQRKGYVSVEPAGDAKDSEEIVWGALENGATDFNTVDSEDPNVLEFSCDPDSLQTLVTFLTKQPCTLRGNELRYVPMEDNQEPSAEEKSSLKELIEDLEENDDVLRVSITVSIDD